MTEKKTPNTIVLPGRYEWFRLEGLNKGWKAAGFDGLYATVGRYWENDSDWFHANIDPEIRDGLWNFCKDDWENKKAVLVRFEGYSKGNTPLHPEVIKVIYADQVDEETKEILAFISRIEQYEKRKSQTPQQQ